MIQDTEMLGEIPQQEGEVLDNTILQQLFNQEHLQDDELPNIPIAE